MNRGACLDCTGAYRYTLWREWDTGSSKVGFVMLNPSRADAVVDDPTIRRCIGFAKTWGFGGLEVVNLFAYRTAHPRDLRTVSEPIGADNDAYLRSLPQRVDRIILAWGNGGTWLNRDRAALQMVSPRPVYCFGVTQVGQPKHPLYIPASAAVIPFIAT